MNNYRIHKIRLKKLDKYMMKLKIFIKYKNKAIKNLFTL